MVASAFNEEFAKIPYGVSVVTVGLGGVENGLAVSWISQISFEPPMLAFAISKTHYSTELLHDHSAFVVNLLKEGQENVAAHFAKQSMLDEDKIDAFPTRLAKSDVPILTDGLAYFDCEVVQSNEVGNHFLVIGEVKDAGILNEARALTSSSGLRYRE